MDDSCIIRTTGNVHAQAAGDSRHLYKHCAPLIPRGNVGEARKGSKNNILNKKRKSVGNSRDSWHLLRAGRLKRFAGDRTSESLRVTRRPENADPKSRADVAARPRRLVNHTN